MKLIWIFQLELWMFFELGPKLFSLETFHGLDFHMTLFQIWNIPIENFLFVWVTIWILLWLIFKLKTSNFFSCICQHGWMGEGSNKCFFFSKWGHVDVWQLPQQRCQSYQLACLQFNPGKRVKTYNNATLIQHQNTEKARIAINL